MTSELTTPSLRLIEGALQLNQFLDSASPPDCGALAIFAGTVRNIHEGRAVTGMRYHAYAPLAERRLAEIEAEAAQRCGGLARVAHAVGELGIGDISVVIVIYSGHRAEAFEACRWAIDTIKHAVPIWKQEHYVEGESRFLEGTPLTEVLPQRSDEKTS